MYREVYATINLDAIKHNTKVIKEFSNKEYFYAIIKANAYGHGAIQVARASIEAGASHLAVAFLDEAIELRKEFPKIPILILGYTNLENLEICAKYALTITITNMEQVEYLTNYTDRPIKIHFKFDSGMNRIGFKTVDEVRIAYGKLRYNKQLEIEGLFTHFATADAIDVAYFSKQTSEFKKVVEALSPFFKIVHCQNSAATLYPIEDFDWCNAVRIGIALYGNNPSDEKDLPIELKQAFSLYAHISHLKQLKKGEKVGYGNSYTMKSDGYVATVPIGYADGIRRSYSGNSVYINNTEYEIIGRVCMDQLMILVDETIKFNDLVEFIGPNISTTEFAKRYNTIEHEVLCGISDRVARVYLANNDIECFKTFRYPNM